MIRFPTLLAVATLAATPLAADDFTDTMQSALTAYEEGDLNYAAEELDFARQMLKDMRSGALTSYLPEAPEGWSMEMDEDTVAGYSMMGAGTSAAAIYTSPNGDEISVAYAVDSPMIAMIAPMLASAQMMGMKLVRVGREKFMMQDEELVGLIDNRIFVQASGADEATMIGLLETVDFEALAGYGN